jgi:4-amino-4-deoxy-L-arabinose transferase
MVSSTDFYDFFVNHQIIDRVANAETFNRSKPFCYYFAFLPLFILPMLSLFIGSLISVFKGNLKSIKGMIVICILLPLLLFSISSSKLILYILPIMPYIALAMAYFLHHLEDRKVRTHLYFACVVYFLIISTILVLSLNLIPSISYTLSLPQFILWVLLLAYLSLGLLKVKENKNKIMLLFLIFPLFILPISTNILKRFELEINSTVPVTEFIKKSQLESQQILVWNRAVNSIPFQLDKTIYSLKYKHYSLNRNTLFQPDSQWKNNLININSEEGKAQVSALIRLPSVLISADKIPEEYNWLLTSFKNRKQLGKWIVYYNNL